FRLMAAFAVTILAFSTVVPLSVTDALPEPVSCPLTVTVPPEGDCRVTGSVNVTALTVIPPVLFDRPIVIPLKPSVSAATSVVDSAKSVAAPAAPITMGRDTVEGWSVSAPVPVIVFALVFNTIESAVMLIAPLPDASVLPAPAVCVNVPLLPVPAIIVIAALAAAVVSAPLSVMAPATPAL